MSAQRIVFIAYVVFLVTANIVHADEAETCPFDKAFETPRDMYGFTVQITSYLEDDLETTCRLLVKTLAGAPILTATEHGIGWVQASAGWDFDGDGKPDLLFEGWTGGAHCCYRYWLVTSGNNPKVWEFFDYDSFVIEPPNGQRVAIFRARDGAFDYFEGPYSLSPLPEILFTVEGNEMNIVTTDDRNLCSTAVPEELDADSVVHFRSTAGPARGGKDRPPPLSGLDTDDPDTMRAILHFVIQQLYCGNEQVAFNSLQKMWPAFDYSRIRKAILNIYEKGSVLQKLRGAAPLQPPVTRSPWTGSEP